MIKVYHLDVACVDNAFWLTFILWDGYTQLYVKKFCNCLSNVVSKVVRGYGKLLLCSLFKHVWPSSFNQIAKVVVKHEY
jgi:hypothetical protein